MNTALTPAASLITHVDGTETPAEGRWTVSPGHTWLILRTRLSALTAEASASGAALAGAVDIATVPDQCRLSLTVDPRRLASDRPVMTRALAGRSLQIDAVRAGQFAVGGWNITGTVASGDKNAAVDSWLTYRGVYRRRHDLAYAWFTFDLTVPAALLGMPAGPMWRRRHVAMSIDIMATADALAASVA